jgi:DNA adenine methylase
MPTLFSESNLRADSILLRASKIEAGYYLPVLEEYQPTKGDFVYLDPPYASENSNGFTSYTKEVFSWPEQQKLAKEFASLARKGCYVMASNVNDHSLKDLYSESARGIIPVKADRMINSKGKQRTGYSELVILSYIPEHRTLEAWLK